MLIQGTLKTKEVTSKKILIVDKDNKNTKVYWVQFIVNRLPS
jgi:hypothetical protein